MLYTITEIFYSVQGEGFHTGAPAVFIRFSGCNLSCPWCDTNHTKQKDMTGPEIVKAVKDLIPASVFSSGFPFLVVLTGGEPTLQRYLPIIQKLKYDCPQIRIAIETNGRKCGDKLFQSYRLRGLLDWVTVSPKILVEDCDPYFDNPNWKGNELKVVLEEGLPLSSIKNLPHRLRSRFSHFYIQPCSGDNNKALQFVKENPQWKLSVQTHQLLKIQ